MTHRPGVQVDDGSDPRSSTDGDEHVMLPIGRKR
jgi:hypothetical protein